MWRVGTWSPETKYVCRPGRYYYHHAPH